MLLYSRNEKQNIVRVLVYQVYTNTEYAQAFCVYAVMPLVVSLNVSAIFFFFFFFFVAQLCKHAFLSLDKIQYALSCLLTGVYALFIFLQPVPFLQHLPGGLYPGKMIFIGGVPKPNAKK